MSFEGKISGSLAPQGAKAGNLSGNIGAVVPDIRDESVTTAKLADAAVTIAKLAQDVTALINSKGDASDVAQLQSDVAALQTITEGLGTASTYGVANNLTQAAAGANVLDAYQGKLLGDRMTTAEGNITTLQSKAAALGKYVFASGKYTTAQWTYGTTTCSLTIPSDGIWIVWGCFEMDNTANRNMYRQLQMQIQGSGSSWLLGVNNIYYDATGTNSNDGIVRTVCAPGNLKAGAVIRPYVHTGDTGVVFTVRLVALRVA